MLDNKILSDANETIINATKALKIIHRLARNVFEFLKEGLSDRMSMKIGGTVVSSQSEKFPDTWLRKYVGAYLTKSKLGIEDLKKENTYPILFYLIALDQKGIEPRVYYGKVRRMKVIRGWKGITTNEYFKLLFESLYKIGTKSLNNHPIPNNYCEAVVDLKYRQLLTLSDEEDIDRFIDDIQKFYYA